MLRTCGPLDRLLAAAAQESAEHVAEPAAHRRVDDPSIEMPCAALMAKVRAAGRRTLPALKVPA
jgi:hypothetical protein